MMRFACSWVILFFFLIGHAQKKDDVVYSFHNNLQQRNFYEAKRDMVHLRRMMDLEILFTNNVFWSEYLNSCSDLNISIDEEEESGLFIDMLEHVYKDNSQKIVEQLNKIVKYYCEEYDGHLAHLFYKKLTEHSNLTLEEKADFLRDIAYAYNYSLNPYKAYVLFKDCCDIYKHLGNKIEYARCLNMMAYVGRFLGKTKLSLPLSYEVKKIWENEYGKVSKEYAIIADNIGSEYLTMGIWDSALVYCDCAYKTFLQINDTTSDIGIALNNLACCYGSLGNTEKELEYLNLSNGYHETNIALFNMGSVYMRTGDYFKALYYFQKTNQEYQQKNAASKIAECYFALGDTFEFIKYENLYFDYYTAVEKNNFQNMLSKDRIQYCTQSRDCNLDSLFSIASRLDLEELAILCYNSILHLKNKSLSCDRSIESIVMSSNSSTKLKTAYSNLLFAKKSKESNPGNYDSLESEFLELLQKEADYTNFLQINYSEILSSLKQEDVAIEFYESDEHDDFQIYAVVIRRERKPVVIKVGTKLNKDNLSSLWIQFEYLFDGVKNIFFSPDGILHTLPIESYPTINNKTYNFYRLSSTRELVNERHTIGQGIVLYGGLIYDMSVQSMKKDALKYPQKRAGEIDLDSTNRWAETTVSYLPGTMTEAKIIAKTINYSKNGKIKVDVLTKNKGTESSFKSLSGKRKRVIHIATHGFYNNKKNQYIKNEGILCIDDIGTDLQNIEDVSLKECGLYFSGANNIIMGDSIPETVDDGVLTAYEISMLDFRGLDLVVLSACETALGDLLGDGVFGLQRGFKKAGAKSILMSLWKVDDESTCLLMTEFYKNWITKGQTKHDALEAAKQTVRSHTEKGWDDPKYWAAFILLDALD